MDIFANAYLFVLSVLALYGQFCNRNRLLGIMR